jgi:hypothetical protein
MYLGSNDCFPDSDINSIALTWAPDLLHQNDLECKLIKDHSYVAPEPRCVESGAKESAFTQAFPG